jgi:branched-chain amino acid transport system substrate-binding protein
MAAVLAAGTFVVTACTGGDDDPVAIVASTTTEPSLPRVDDGVLRIGALIPVNDPTVGANLTSSFEQAVEAVNAAGGVLGRDVQFLVEDEGTSATSAAQATELLIEGGVDAIVGPTSSNTAIGALDAAVAAGIVMCSATATAISLDEFPDDGLFFRSVATDSLQAAGIAREAEIRGASSVVVIHIDDAYGQPYAAAVVDALGAQPSIRVTSVAVPFGDDDLQDDLDQVAAVGADTGIVLGGGDDIARLLEAISTRDDIDLSQVIVNDAARAPANRPVIAGLEAGFRNRIVGLSPQILLPESVGSDDDTPFASQVTDCVNLIALAVEQGESDAPVIIASQMTSVSSGGEECRTFAECTAQLDAEEEIDYDGPTRITELARDGDPSRAFFDRFGFRADGSSEYESSLAVS